ncbi:MAG: hypothetical protein EXR99_09945 [Gemmataceae bacterium]|nr:hypothetical protein [Gemmataceae bacterium]
MRLIRTRVWVCLCSLAWIGCQGQYAGPVSGKVVIDGRPAPGILVEFVPLKDGPKSHGETDAKGQFVLIPANGQRILFGRHKVVLQDLSGIEKFLGTAGDGKDASQGKKSRLDPAYSALSQTPLIREVSPGDSFFPFEIP